MVIIDWIINI